VAITIGLGWRFRSARADCCAGIEFAGLPMDAEKVGVLQDIALRSLGVKSLKIAVVFK